MAMTQEEQQEYRDSASLLSAEELRGMRDAESPEEAAIIDSLLNAGKAVEVPGGTKDADEEPEDEPQPDDDPEDEDEPEEDPAPEAEPEAEPVAEVPAPAAEPAPAVDFTPPPLDLSGLTVELNEKLAVLATEKKEAFAKLMAGEMDADAYSDLEEQNLTAREQLREQQQLQTRWFTDVHNFRIKAAQESGINYFADAEKDAALDGWVQHLAKNPANADKPAPWFLEQAHKKVMVEFDIAPPAPKPAENGTKNVADGKKVAPNTARTPNLSNIPPTLGGLPAAAPATGGDGGEFAHLERLTGYEQELAVARLTQAQRDRWEQM